MGKRCDRRNAARAGPALCLPESRRSPFAACTTASSITSATSGPRSCSCCTKSTRWPSRTDSRKSPARRWPRIVHSNVGLMHASMAVFDAWCDRVPVIVLGATGAVDAAKRRPWIEWIHTAQDQGALVRHFIKWDAQPASVACRVRGTAARQPDCADGAEGSGVRLLRHDAAGAKARRRCRRCPTCVVMRRRSPPIPRRNSSREPWRCCPPPGIRCSSWAASPAILRHGTPVSRWPKSCGPRSSPTLKVGAAFPTDHPLHAAPPAILPRRRIQPPCCAKRMSC